MTLVFKYMLTTFNLTLCVVIVAGTITCPSICQCKGKRALCKGGKVTYIPRFPPDIMRINISNTNISVIKEDGLLNLTFNHIIEVTLHNNSLKYIHSAAFRNITNIIVIHVSYERALIIDNLKDVFENMETRHIQKLYFINNGWNHIPKDMFKSFPKHRLKNIYLNGNNLPFINGSTFAKLTKLLRIDLRENKIENINTKGFTTLREMDLQHNALQNIPNWCDGQTMVTNVPYLKRLRLSFNFITRLPNFECLPRLSFLSLRYNFVSAISNQPFRNLPNLQELNLNAVGNPVRVIEQNVFNISSLRILTLTYCHFHFDKLSQVELVNFLSHSKNLEVLNLANNILPSDPVLLKLFFQSVSKLKKLHLNTCRLYRFSIGILSNHSLLEDLTLKGNNLQSLEKGGLTNGSVTSLKHLDLGGNRINIFNSSSIPVQILSSLSHINIGGNPFYCVCDQMWFVNWLRTTNVTVEQYPYRYKCAQPPEMKNTLLLNYKPTKKTCTPWNPMFTITLSLSIFGVLILLIITITVKCLTNIKNVFYLIRVSSYRKLGYLPIDDSAEFEYTAFVVYCDADRKWVHDKFVKKLESEEDIRLCIHHRDFEVGETISGNIDNLLRKSWKVVVIVSNEFAKSEWCQWEVDIVQERRRRLGRDVFLVIMLKEVTSKYMTSPIRTLLDSTPFLRYKHGIGEDLFWKAAKRGLQKPVGHPPVSVFS